MAAHTRIWAVVGVTARPSGRSAGAGAGAGEKCSEPPRGRAHTTRTRHTGTEWKRGHRKTCVLRVLMHGVPASATAQDRGLGAHLGTDTAEDTAEPDALGFVTSL